MGLRSWASAAEASLDFQNDTDKAEGGLMMLFFGLVFSVALF